MDLSQRIAIAMAFIGLAAGFVMYRSDFCLAGMVRDFVFFREKRLLRPFALTVLISAPAFWLLRYFGFAPYLLFAPPSLNPLLGGVAFGFGMTLSGACVAGTFWKLGSGQGLQIATLTGLVAGSALFAELYPFFAELAKSTRFSSAATLPELLGVSPLYIIAPLLLAGGVLLLHWSKKGYWKHKNFARGYIQPWQAGIATALLGTASVAVTGMPLSAATLFAKTAGFLESVFLPAHFEKTVFFKSSLIMELPLQEGVLNWGNGPAWDSATAVQVPFLLFLTLGGFIGAKSAGDLEWHFRVPPAQFVSALLGGIAMGLGARIGGGCNLWHLFGGLPFLSTGSLVFFLGLYPGAWMGVRLLSWKVLS